MLNASEWAAQQWALVDLGDKRLNQRAVIIGAKMAAQPEASLPNQMGGRAELQGAYRLMNHAEVTMDKLLSPHCQATLAAAGQATQVLMLEDTTELDYTAHPHMQGVGPIGNGGGQGLLLHTTLAVVAETEAVLGVAQAHVVLRQPSAKPRPKWTRSAEGRVWELSADKVGQPPAGSVWVHVGDGGSDIFEFMAACRNLDKHFIVRSSHNRVLARDHETAHVRQVRERALQDYARSLPEQPNSAYTIHLPATAKLPAREAHLALAWTPILIPPPSQAPADVRQLPTLQTYVVRAWEPDPPSGAQPVEWILITSLPVHTLADAQRIVRWYSLRWMCEDFHQCLKTGCRVEDSQLDDGADVQRLLGFAIPIAARLLQLRQAARHTPDVPAQQVVEPLMVHVLAQRLKVQAESMTTLEFWKAVARLGGHQGRRRDGAPGWRTVWRGWRLLSDWTDGAQLFAGATG